MTDASGIIADAVGTAIDSKIAKALGVDQQTMPCEYMGEDSEGKAWVLLPGADSVTPVRRSSVEASAGDTVSVTIRDGRAVIDSNISNPSAGVASVQVVDEKAESAAQMAASATNYAESAYRSASAAYDSMNEAKQSAAIALETANGIAATAQEAKESANAASQSASDAHQSAQYAAYGLSEVEKVVGTVNWIAEHGYYFPTEDTSIVSGKNYYTRTDTYFPTEDEEVVETKTYYEYDPETETYSAVTPVGDEDPSEEGWYELSTVYTYVFDPDESRLSEYYEFAVDESVQNYLQSHIMQTDYGLDLMFDGTSDRVHIGTVNGQHERGVYMYRGGVLVGKYGSSAVIGDERSAHISIGIVDDKPHIGLWANSQLEVAYVSGQELHIDRTVVISSMRVGDWQWTKMPSGNLRLQWIGSEE